MPKGMIGVLWRAQSWTICCTSSGLIGEDHGVRQVRFVIRDVLAVLFAHGVRGADPVAEERLQLGDRGIDVGRFRLGRCDHVVLLA